MLKVWIIWEMLWNGIVGILGKYYEWGVNNYIKDFYIFM
jgi:hypothetical protein